MSEIPFRILCPDDKLSHTKETDRQLLLAMARKLAKGRVG
jgi:hypothetical protein